MDVEKASQSQLKFIHDLGYVGKQPFSKSDASKLINKLKTIEQANALRDKVNYTPSDNDMKALEKIIGMYTTCLIKCVDVDITEGAVIGMILNNWRQSLEK